MVCLFFGQRNNLKLSNRVISEYNRVKALMNFTFVLHLAYI